MPIVTSDAVTSDPDASGAIHGPGGALAYPQGAAYVPPEARGWWEEMERGSGVPDESRLDSLGSRTAERYPSNLAEEAFDLLPHSKLEPIPPAQKKQRRTKRKVIDPGQLTGRIIAATRKADRLARGNASERRQAAAIRRNIEVLRAKQERAQERQTAAWYTVEECDAWLEAQDGQGGPALAEAAPAPPSSSYPEGVPDYAVVAQGLAERLRLRASA